MSVSRGGSKFPSTQHAGILRKVTDADIGRIERPLVTPHLEFRPIEDDRVLLVSETFNTLLSGRIHVGLFPLLDGRHSAAEIAAALASEHAARDVDAALASLASRNYVVSGDHGLEHGSAAYWSSLGASPRFAEERLAASSVEIIGDDGRLGRQLGAMGVGAAPTDRALAVSVCADYLDPEHAGMNQRHLGSGAPWMLLRPRGMQPLFGPVFRPAERGPCWTCLAYRLQSHREVHNFLRNRAGDDAAFRPTATAAAPLDAVYGLAAAEIAKWLVLGRGAPLHERAISLDLANLASQWHPVMRRPQCSACGDESLFRPDRQPAPLRLHPSPKTVSNSGGVRTVSPQETLAKYRHLISPVSGVVTWLTRTTQETDTWLHVYWAGSNPALRSRSLSSLRRSLRSKSAGKGSTRQQSEVSALCEAVERYSCTFHGDEIRCRRRFADFLADGKDEAIHPNAVQLFSERQLEAAARINARGHPYNIVPPRFDLEREIEWSPVWSFSQQRHRYLPTAMLYGMTPEQRGDVAVWADSNGCAAGNTLEEAILHGFYELVERDAIAIWWYNRLRVPGVDLKSFETDYLAQANAYYRSMNRDVWVLDVTADLGIPVFVALSRRTDTATEDIIYGAGAHADPQIAALRAVCEMNQCLTWVPRPGSSGYGVDDPMCLSWWQNARLADSAWLAPDPAAELRGRSDYPVPDTRDAADDVERCRELVEANGLEFLVLDQTRPDIGMPVARVIVPGLRHFWERFAPGRLYEVPVAMGWRDEALAEADLNPVPVIA